VHPRMIEASLSEKEGILGHTKKILAGTVTTDPASHLAKDENKRELDTLHTDLVTLEQIMRSGNAVETKKQLDKIQTERGVDLHGNTGQKLEDFLKNLNTKGVDTKKAGVAGNKDLEAVKDSIKTI
jgi:heterodisulfide reductase subunit C